MLTNMDYILTSRTDIKIIKYGSTKVTKVPKLCREMLSDRKVMWVLFFNNKGRVAQILVQEHKCVPVECYVENSQSKLIKTKEMLDH